tara:strand:+ start:12288 stop:12452 length:165 start_codon:yes stop_codon:yes gene_type:complete
MLLKFSIHLLLVLLFSFAAGERFREKRYGPAFVDTAIILINFMFLVKIIFTVDL